MVPELFWDTCSGTILELFQTILQRPVTAAYLRSTTHDPVCSLNRQMEPTLCQTSNQVTDGADPRASPAKPYDLQLRDLTGKHVIILGLSRTTALLNMYRLAAHYSQGINESTNFRFLQRLSVIFGFQQDSP